MPEQVYDSQYDVWYMPDDTDGSDGSGSGSTPSNVQGLVDSLNNSTESDRGVTFWSNIVNAFRDFFKNGVKVRSTSDVLDNPSTWQGVVPDTNDYSYIKKPASDKAIERYNDILSKNNPDYKPISLHSEDNKVSGSEQISSDVNEWLDLMKQLIDKQYQFNESNALRAQQFEVEQAQKLRDWQEYMSSTSYQRAMADLKKAGINPLLAFQTLSGASTPSGAMASGFNASGSLGNASSYYGALTSQLGQNKALGTNFLNILIRLLTLLV